MVNKQYTVQHHHSSCSSKHSGRGKRFSPPPVRSLSTISDTPNPINFSADKDKFNGCEIDDGDINQYDLNVPNLQEEHTQSVYGRNISLYNRGEASDRKFANSEQSDDYRFSVKELSINDIGRFQYILQMDREMGTHPDSLYRIPSRIQSSSNGSSINSSHHINFWKAGSESPITSSARDSRTRRQEIFRHLKDFWKYAKWPLLLIILCIFLGCLILYLITEQQPPAPEDQVIVVNVSTLQEPRGLIGNPQVIENNSLEEDDDGGPDDSNEQQDEVLTIYMRNPKVTTTERPRSTESVLLTTVEEVGTTETMTETTPKPHFTSPVPVRNTQILRITTQSGLKFDDDYIPTTESLDKDKNPQDPTKETLHIIGFTSGHQNNFGIPIEEDERILKMLNEELLRYEQNETSHSADHSTTDASIYKTRVSPTLPVIFHRESTTEETTEVLNVTDVGICESTSLAICRGILHYDLTTSRARKKLNSLELEHFRYLFESKCSARAAEFVCSALEPECRPTQMGILQPCKRICKSILEPCASIIASSEILTMTFDCDRYPDSSDRNVCEDPTRRGICNENEFKCLDSSCIPQQWKCDNIKDCSLGEDEDNCLFCEHEEFRCKTNDKCIPDKWRCDQYDDCPDGSDEADCYDYEEDADGPADEYPNTRIYSFASIQAPDSPNSRPYITISGEDRLNDDEKNTYETTKTHPYASSPIDNFDELNYNQTNEAKDESDEIQTGEASGRVVVGLPKNIANFQDSKEIMMTSDSETDFKFSAMNRSLATTTTTTTRSEDTTQAVPHCPENQLRCVSGDCISVTQICDRTIDCPDGADEAMCVYKDQ